MTPRPPNPADRYQRRSRVEAKLAGEKFYFTGQSCHRGHICQRYVSSFGCIECHAMMCKQWSAENIDKRREFDRRYYRRNPAKYIAKNKTPQRKSYGARWYLAHRERLLAEAAKRVKANPGRKQELARARRKAFPDKAREDAHNAYAKRKKSEGKHTAVEVKRLFKLQNGKCANPLCRKRLKKYHQDHILPICAGGTNWISNIQLLCPPCNGSKGRRHPIEWARKSGLLV